MYELPARVDMSCRFASTCSTCTVQIILLPVALLEVVTLQIVVVDRSMASESLLKKYLSEVMNRDCGRVGG